MGDNLGIDYGKWGLNLLDRFYGAVDDGSLPDFLRSKDLNSYLHRFEALGSIGSDGSEPNLGKAGSDSTNPLDVLHDIFTAIGSSLGRIDRPDGENPAARPPGDNSGPTVIVVTTYDPTTNTTMITRTFKGGGQEIYSETPGPHGRAELTSVNGDKIIITPDGHGGTIEERSTSQGHTFQHRNSDGKIMSPGEDEGGDTNNGRNPLSGLEALGPQSLQQMTNALKHPGKDTDELDPNAKANPANLSEADREHVNIGSSAGEYVVDPNIGMDPLSQLNLDPNKMAGSRDDEENRIDPTTGLLTPPVRGGGGNTSDNEALASAKAFGKDE